MKVRNRCFGALQDNIPLTRFSWLLSLPFGGGFDTLEYLSSMWLILTAAPMD